MMEFYEFFAFFACTAFVFVAITATVNIYYIISILIV